MMHAPIFDQVLRERLERQPFRPFAIEFDDGGRIIVDAREAMMMPSNGNTVGFDSTGAMHFLYCEEVKQIVEATPAN